MVIRRTNPGGTLPERVEIRGYMYDAVGGGGVYLGYSDRETAERLAKDFADGLLITQKSWKDIPDREIAIVPFREMDGTDSWGIYQRVFRDSLTAKTTFITE